MYFRFLVKLVFIMIFFYFSTERTFSGREIHQKVTIFSSSTAISFNWYLKKVIFLYSQQFSMLEKKLPKKLVKTVEWVVNMVFTKPFFII